jgi:hypothetical protein
LTASALVGVVKDRESAGIIKAIAAFWVKFSFSFSKFNAVILESIIYYSSISLILEIFKHLPSSAYWYSDDFG